MAPRFVSAAPAGANRCCSCIGSRGSHPWLVTAASTEAQDETQPIVSTETFARNFGLLTEASNGVQKLRELILQLAVQGRLVPQATPHGETQDETNDGLPSGWQILTIVDIAEVLQPGFACSKAHQKPNGYVHLRTHNVGTDGRLNFDTIVAIEESKVDRAKAHLQRGDIIFNNTNSQELVGKSCLVDQDYGYAFSNHLTRIRLKPGNDPAYVVCYLVHLRQSKFFFDLCNRWINQAGINTKVVKQLEIPLPPEDEQHRILAKVDQLMALCDELDAAQTRKRETRERLNNAALDRLLSAETPAEFAEHWQRICDHFDLLYDTPDTIAQLRQAILRLAVQGKVVPQDPDDEPASALLDRVKAEKERLAKEGKVRKSKPLSPIDEASIPYGLPRGWVWARFPELGELARGKSKHRPRNAPHLFEGGKYPLVQTGDVARANGVISTYTGEYNEVGLAQSRRWPHGTMCITIAANIADSGVLGMDACFPDSVVGFLPSAEVGSATYFEYFMRTAKERLQDFAPSTAQKNLNLSILQGVLIPLPPRAEIDRVVAKVDHLMSLCDALEAKLTQAQSDSEKLMEATVHHLVAS